MLIPSNNDNNKKNKNNDNKLIYTKDDCHAKSDNEYKGQQPNQL